MRVLITIGIGFVFGILSIIIFGEIEFAQQSVAWDASCEEYRQKLIESGQPYLVLSWEDGEFVLRDPITGAVEAVKKAQKNAK